MKFPARLMMLLRVAILLELLSSLHKYLVEIDGTLYPGVVTAQYLAPNTLYFAQR